MQNIKYGSIKLVNTFNIVNSVDSYKTFLDGLAGEYESKKDGVSYKAEDKGQSYRRFPIIIPIYEDSFDIMFNKGFMDNSAEFTEFVEYHGIRGNFQRLNERLSNNPNRLHEMETKLLELPTKKGKEYIDRESHELSDEEAQQIIDAEFADYVVMTGVSEDPDAIFGRRCQPQISQQTFDDLLYKNKEV